MTLNSIDLENIIQSLDECITQKKGLATHYGAKGKNKAAADLQLNVIALHDTQRKIRELLINNSFEYSVNANAHN